MRRLVLGIDESGRSCIVDDGIVTGQDIAGLAGVSVAQLWSIDTSPPPPVAKGLGRYRPGVLPPGHVDWYVIDHAPKANNAMPLAMPAMHYRDVVDLLLIIEGSAQLILGDGPHSVAAGDCIVMAGTEHAFRPDPGGCRLMGFAIGAETPAH